MENEKENVVANIPDDEETNVEQRLVMGEIKDSSIDVSFERRCPKCQALIVHDEIFCSECGTMLKSVCLKCGTQLDDGQLFCPECGTRVAAEPEISNNIAVYNQSINTSAIKKGKSKITKITIGGILTLLLLIAGYFGYMYHIKQQVLNYAVTSEKYVTQLQDTYTNLDLMNKSYKIVSDGSWLYRDYLQSYANSINSETISEAQTANTVIVELFDEIIKCDIKNSYVDTIKSKASETQQLYLTVYKAVIINETGYNSTNLTQLQKKLSELETIINEVKEEYGSKKTKQETER